MDNGFAADLARFGPESRRRAVSLDQARSYCRRLARSHYENFSVASLLLPRRLLSHFQAVYAYCRWADDLADETANAARAHELLRWWGAELRDCYAGQPRHPVMVALAPTIGRFRIPAQVFLDLLVAFEQDQHVKRYATFAELLNYCKYSANPVGQLVLYLSEAFTPQRAALADPICTALQLANFWQDVARDFEIGRVYLPEEDRRQFGYTEDDFAAQRFTPEFARLLRFEVERTRTLFQRGEPLLRTLPGELRPQVELFLRGGLATLRKIEQVGYNVWHTRPKLSKWDKAGLIAHVGLRRLAETLV